MTDDEIARNYIGECALHQNREDVSVNVYDGLSEVDRLALARMTSDGDGYDPRRWTHPPDEL